jgi:hypothetical protein
MDSQDPVLHCLDRLNLGEHAKLRERSQYFYNQCSKVPPKVLSKGINSQPVISIQLACERYQLNKRKALTTHTILTCTHSAWELVTLIKHLPTSWPCVRHILIQIS